MCGPPRRRHRTHEMWTASGVGPAGRLRGGGGGGGGIRGQVDSALTRVHDHLGLPSLTTPVCRYREAGPRPGGGHPACGLPLRPGSPAARGGGRHRRPAAPEPDEQHRRRNRHRRPRRQPALQHKPALPRPRAPPTPRLLPQLHLIPRPACGEGAATMGLTQPHRPRVVCGADP